MALTGEALRNRIKSAAALHGWGLRHLRVELERYGAKKHMAERVVAGKVPLTDANLTALTEVLGVPREWFEAEDWRPLVHGGNGASQSLELQEQAVVALAELNAGQEKLAGQLDQLLDEATPQRKRGRRAGGH